ncbi:MAG TPA: translation initiation factor IF-2 [Firmicutes bacterium]|nr:translation initiation factor IF-2 [Bacillota bacterium]
MATKMRVYELSKELGIQSKDLLIILNEMGAGVKNHMSTVEEEYIAKVRASFNPEGKSTPRRETKETAKPTGVTVPAAKAKTEPEKKTEPVDQERGKPKVKPAEKTNGPVRTPKDPPPKTAAPSDRPTAVKKETEQRRPTPVKPPTAGGKPTHPPTGTRSQAVDGKGGMRAPATKGKGGERTGRPAPAGGPGKPVKAAPSGQRGWATSPAGKPAGKDDGRKKHDPKTQKWQAKEKENFNKVQPHKKRPEAKKPAPAHPTTNVKFVQIPERITVKEFAQAIEVSVSEVIKKLIGLGVMASINQEIDLDTAILVGAEFNVTVEGAPTEEETLLIEEIEDSPESLKPRWPVVTIMGHVDHGKTSLLDAIRQTNVIASEAGGITQHIGAYQVEINDKKITFLDTPGHEAFTAMRARGAQVTDIAVLVVAADDGVMPQTVEAINHGKAADVPIIVAINKIDKPTANPDRVKQELTQYGLVPEEWGGDTICVEVSALKKQGLEELLEMILLVAEMRELKANPDRPAKGTVIEAKLDKGRGPVATVLVQNGTLKQGDTIIAGEVSGKVRALVNDKGKTVKKAGPSVPVEVVGFDDLPEAGDIFYVTDEKTARQLADRRQQFRREQSLKREQKFKLEDLFARIKEGEMKELNIVLKADVQGSVEAIQSSLERLSNDEVRVRVIHGGVGAISESDVMLASASGAIIIGFNVRPDPIAKRVAEREDVDVRLYRIIYDIVDDVKKAMEGMLEPEYREVVLGRAEVRATFKVPKVGTVAGCYVTEGKITRNSEARVLRDNVVVFEGIINSLKRFKDDVREVASGFECGIGLERFNDIKEGDVIEAFTTEEIKKTTTEDSLK